MSSIFLKTITTAALGMALSSAAAFAADYVILDSTAAGIEPGIVVSGLADITIPDGAQVVLIDPEGATLVIEGPFTGQLVAAATSSNSGLTQTLDSLTTSRGDDTTVLGAVRGVPVDGGSVTE
jgi:hypothetical protein